MALLCWGHEYMQWPFSLTNVQMCTFFTALDSVNHITLFWGVVLRVAQCVSECVAEFKMNRDVVILKNPKNPF